MFVGVCVLVFTGGKCDRTRSKEAAISLGQFMAPAWWTRAAQERCSEKWPGIVVKELKVKAPRPRNLGLISQNGDS